MTTLTGIHFNGELFLKFDYQLVILFEITGVNPVLPIIDIDLLTFVQHFDKIISCQNFIRENNQRKITLFIYCDNIQTWIWNGDSIPDNVDQIIVFCPCANDKSVFLNWANRYVRKEKETHIYTFDQLEYGLLVFGMNYICELCLKAKENSDDLVRLKLLKENICLALIRYIQKDDRR